MFIKVTYKTECLCGHLICEKTEQRNFIAFTRNESLEINLEDFFSPNFHEICCIKCKRLNHEIKQIYNFDNKFKFLIIRISTQIEKNNEIIYYKTSIKNFNPNLVKISGNHFRLQSAIVYLPNIDKSSASKGHYVCYTRNINNQYWMKISDFLCESYSEFNIIGLKNVFILLFEKL